MRAAQRFRRIVAAHERSVVRRNANRQRAGMALDREALVGAEHEHAFEVVQRTNAFTQLPAPVVPLDLRRAGEILLVECARGRVDGERIGSWSGRLGGGDRNDGVGMEYRGAGPRYGRGDGAT